MRSRYNGEPPISFPARARRLTATPATASRHAQAATTPTATRHPHHHHAAWLPGLAFFGLSAADRSICRERPFDGLIEGLPRTLSRRGLDDESTASDHCGYHVTTNVERVTSVNGFTQEDSQGHSPVSNSIPRRAIRSLPGRSRRWGHAQLHSERQCQEAGRAPGMISTKGLTGGRPMAISTVSASCRALAGNHGWLSRISTDWRSPAYSRYTEPTCTGSGANGQSSGVRKPSTSSGTRPDSPSLISSPRAVAASSPSTRGSELSSAWRHPLTTDARNCLPVTASPHRTIRNLALQHRCLAHPRQRVAHEADDRAVAQPPAKALHFVWIFSVQLGPLRAQAPRSSLRR